MGLCLTFCFCGLSSRAIEMSRWITRKVSFSFPLYFILFYIFCLHDNGGTMKGGFKKVTPHSEVLKSHFVCWSNKRAIFFFLLKKIKILPCLMNFTSQAIRQTCQVKKKKKKPPAIAQSSQFKLKMKSKTNTVSIKNTIKNFKV